MKIWKIFIYHFIRLTAITHGADFGEEAQHANAWVVTDFLPLFQPALFYIFDIFLHNIFDYLIWIINCANLLLVNKVQHFQTIL